MSNVERFASLFEGFSEASGRFQIEGAGSSGKIEGSALTVKGIPNFQQHLEGSVGAGVIALRDDDTVVFSAIDVDDYSIEVKDLEKKIRKHKLPLVVCRSKSGGAHCYIFLEKPTPAAQVTETLRQWAASLGHGGCEIFPKQSRRAGPEDIGNWINLPYFDAEETLRYCVKGGKALTLEEFLDFAEKSKVLIEKVSSLTVTKDAHPLLKDAPPCLCHMQSIGGAGEGVRNDSMYTAGIYCKKRWPDDWKERLAQVNGLVCSPPLPDREVKQLIASLQRHETYDMKCQGPYCNRRACSKAVYGRGQGAHGMNIDINSITMYDGDPVFWVVDIDEQRIMMATDDLFSQHRFIKLCMEKLRRVPSTMSSPRWLAFLDEMIKDCEMINPPYDAGVKGQFFDRLDAFCTETNRRAQSIDEVVLGKPYLDKNEARVYFKSQALFDYLDERRFRYDSYHKVWQWLREQGATKSFKNIKGKGVNLWVIDAPAEFDNERVTSVRKLKEAF